MEIMERLAKKLIKNMDIYCDYIAVDVVKFASKGKEPHLVFDSIEEKFYVVDSEKAKNYILVNSFSNTVNIDKIVELYKKVMRYSMYSKVNEEALDKIASMNDIEALEKLMENDIQNIYEYIMFLARDSGLVDTIYDSIVEFFSSNVCDIYETDDYNSLLTI